LSENTQAVCEVPMTLTTKCWHTEHNNWFSTCQHTGIII